MSVKISDLPIATTLTGNELVMINSGNVNQAITTSNLRDSLKWTLCLGARWPSAQMAVDFRAGQGMSSGADRQITSLLTCVRATSGWAEGIDGTLQEFSANELRITDKGLLVEEARSNLELNATNLSGGYKNNVTITANDGSAPDGSATANKFDFTASGQRNGSSVSVTPSTSYVFSLFVKDDGGGGTVRLSMSGGANWPGGTIPNLDYNLATGALTNHTNVDNSAVQDFADGWKRIWFSCTTDTSVSGASTLVIYSLSAVTFYAWGMMLEEGSFPTSYIKTTGAAATRAADNVAFSDLSWLNEVAGTVLVEYLPFSDNSASYPIFTLNKDNTSDILLKMDKRSNGKFGTLIENSGTQFFKEEGIFVEGQSVKIACGFSSDNVNSSVDGSLGTADTNATLPTGINNLRVGQNEYGVSSGAGWIKSLIFWPERKTNTDLQGLTT